MADGDAEVLREGHRFAGYEVRRQVGRGGAGIVYEAEHLALGRRVALKTLHQRVTRDAAAVERLRREARTLCRLRHPGLVEVYDLGLEGDVPYMAMEFLEGQSLADLLASGPLPVARAVELARSALAALAVVHGAGVVHRDVKPSNLYVVDTAAGPQLKLLDFGLCTALDEASTLTRSGGFVGTPHYAAPELLDGGRPFDRRVDLYSLALVLYEAVTGRRAFSEDRMLALVGAIARGVRTPPSEVLPTLPRALDAVILRGCALDPADRFDDAAAFAEALAPFTRAAPPDGPVASAAPDAPHAPALAAPAHVPVVPPVRARAPAVAVVVAASVLVALAIAVSRRSPASRPVAAREVASAPQSRLVRPDEQPARPLPKPPVVAVVAAPRAAPPPVSRVPASQPRAARRAAPRVRRGAGDASALPVRDPSAVFGGAR